MMIRVGLRVMIRDSVRVKVRVMIRDSVRVKVRVKVRVNNSQPNRCESRICDGYMTVM